MSGSRAEGRSSPLCAVIFDMDGVLVDSGEPHKESWKALGRELGRPITDEEFAHAFGRPSRDIILSLFGAHLSPEAVRAMDERKEALYRELIRDHVPIMSGAPALLARLARSGLRLAIGSSGPIENIRLVVDALKPGPGFEAIVSGFDVKRGKPDPEVFLLAAERLGVAPAQALVVEDAPVGIEAARRAGMRVVALTSSHPREALADADLVVDRLEDIDPYALAPSPSSGDARSRATR